MANFEDERRTRLLMVLVQSGQDSEMGTATLKESVGPKLGTAKVQSKISFAGNLSLSHSIDDFEKLGVFNASSRMESREDRAVLFGNNPFNSSSGSTRAFIDSFDLELERALALSRGEIEMKDALELNKRDSQSNGDVWNDGVANSVDDELQLAIARSKADSSVLCPKSHAQSEVVDINSYEEDLREAIKRSLDDSSHISTCRGAVAAKTEPTVVDLGDKKGDAQKPSAAKRVKVHQKQDTVIEIIDDDDEKIEDEKKEAQASSPKSRHYAVTDLAEKRRLAAEAAENRLSLKKN